MADVTLTPQNVDKDGVAPSYTSIDNVDTYKFRNSSKTMLHFKNTGGAPAVVTEDTPGSVSGVAIGNPIVSVPATTGERMIGMQPTSLFNDGGGIASFTQDQATGVSVAVLQIR